MQKKSNHYKNHPLITILSCLITALLLLTPLAFAQEVNTGINEELENLYQYESLTTNIVVSGSFDLNKEKNSATISEMTAKLAMYPYENFYQTIQNEEIIATPNTNNINEENDEIVFTWDNPNFESHNYQVQTQVKTSQNNHILTKNPKFPLELTDDEIENYDLNKFLAVTQTIDWDDSSVQAKAIELSQGKDNLFEIAFELASWVEENVNYELTSLNKETSQKASTVLRTKSGVCDEMTSLFIAMARSLGIPAKFVSGLTYTNSELFDDPWQAHGWAEVYFPGHGWVAFDPTFGEYGYVDATHIPMKEGTDPTEYSTFFRWLGNGIDLEDHGLELSATVITKDKIAKQKYDVETQILADSVQFGSYNLISAYLEDNTGTFQAATLELFVPQEIEIISRAKQSVIVENHGQTAMFWIIKVDDNLQENFRYTFPYVIRTDTGEIHESSFQAQESNQLYTKENVESLVPNEKTLLALEAIDMSCEYNKQIQTNAKETISCSIKNIQNKDIKNLNICHKTNCETANIKAGETYAFNSELLFEKPGWKNQIISIKNSDISYTATLPLQVLDTPKITIEIKAPEQITYKDTFQVTIIATQESFAPIQNVNMDLHLGTATYNWKIDEFSGEETIVLEAGSEGLTRQNFLTMSYTWQDNEDNTYQGQTQTQIQVNPTDFTDNINMLLNKLSIWLTSI